MRLGIKTSPTFSIALTPLATTNTASPIITPWVTTGQAEPVNSSQNVPGDSPGTSPAKEASIYRSVQPATTE